MKKRFRLPVLFICLTAMLFTSAAAYADPDTSAETGAVQTEAQNTAETAAPDAGETAAVPEEVPAEASAPAEESTAAEAPLDANAEVLLFSSEKELLILNFDSAYMQLPAGFKEADIVINGQKRIGLVPGSYQNGTVPQYVILYGMYAGTQIPGLFRYDMTDQTLQKYYAPEPETGNPSEGEAYSVSITQELPEVAPEEEETTAETTGAAEETEKKTAEKAGEEDVPMLKDDGRFLHLGRESLEGKQLKLYAEKNRSGEWEITEEKYYDSSFMQILPYIIIGVVEAVVILLAAIFLSSNRK